jgi:hypothetical protein
VLQHLVARLTPFRRRRRNPFLMVACCALFSALLLGRLAMSLARDEYVIRITVVNETDEFQNIFIFQQEDELGLMFDKIFPLAWQVFPLPGKEESIERKGEADYPASRQIGVTRIVDAALAAAGRTLLLEIPGLAGGGPGGQPAMEQISLEDQPDAGKTPGLKVALRGELIIKAKAANGDAFVYSFDPKEGQHLDRLSDKNQNGSITCRNGSDSLIDVDYYKDFSRLVVWPKLASGDKARFLLKRTISFACGDGIRPGQMIRQKITGENVVSVDPAGCSKIDVLLTYDPDSPGRKKKWVISKQ